MGDSATPLDEEEFVGDEAEVTNLTTKLLGDFKAETNGAKEDLERAARKARKAARTVREKDSVRNLRAISQRPAPANGSVAGSKKG